MSLGTILALISAAIATVFAGIGSIRGVGMSAEAGMGVLAEDPSKFGKLLVLGAAARHPGPVRLHRVLFDPDEHRHFRRDQREYRQ